MENASKALIIAGAILISIVIISLGVVIIGQGQDVVNDSNMDKQKITTWNQQFTQYVGDSVSGSNVNTLINDVIASNVVSNRDGSMNKLIVVTPGATKTGDVKVTSTTKGKDGATTYTSAFTSKALPGKKYKVEVTGYSNDGYIRTIKVTMN